MAIDEILKKYRSASGKTQQEVADYLGVKRTAYAAYETGRVNMDAQLLQKIAYLYNVTIDELLQPAAAYPAADNVVNDAGAATAYTPQPGAGQYSTAAQKSIRKPKIDTQQPYMAPFISVKAQAGYAKAFDQVVFLDEQEKHALPPGITHLGASWAYWEIAGDSMEPTFHNKDIILTSMVHPMDWENIRDFYVYVIVTEDRVLIKRIVAKNAL